VVPVTANGRNGGGATAGAIRVVAQLVVGATAANGNGDT
jgi:hypothetical protein